MLDDFFFNESVSYLVNSLSKRAKANFSGVLLVCIKFLRSLEVTPTRTLLFES